MPRIATPTLQNQLAYSDDFTGYSQITCTIGQNAVNSPFGMAQAIIPSVGSGQHYITTTLPASTVNVTAGWATFSVYSYALGFRYIRVQLGSGANNPLAYFDLQNGSIGTIVGENLQNYPPTIEAVKGWAGWYRCSITFKAAKTTIFNSVYLLCTNTDNSNISTGDGVSGIAVIGAQVTNANWAGLS